MSFGLLFIFIVMVFWRPQEWLLPWLFGIPILDAVTFGAILALMLEYDTGRVRINFKEPQFFLYIGLFIAGLMSHISHFYWAGLMMSWMDMFRITFFGVLLFACINSVSHLRWMARAFVVMALLMAFHSILQDTQGYGFAGHRPVLSWRPNVDYLVPRSRFFGIFDDPNDLGQFLVTSMPMCFVLFKRTNLITKLMGAGLVYYIVQGLLPTYSRGSQVGLVVALSVALVMMIFRRGYLVALGVLVILGLFAIPFSGPFLGEAWERVNLWGQANWAFRTSPIFGVGRAMIRDYTDGAKAVHNAYVSCYAEIGIFGYFFWISLIVIGVLGLLQTRRALRHSEDPEAQWLYRFSMWGTAAMAGFFTSAFFISRAFVFPLYFMTAMMGSVPYLARRYIDEDYEIPKLAFTIKETTIIGIPISFLTILYVYVTILVLNMQR